MISNNNQVAFQGKLSSQPAGILLPDEKTGSGIRHFKTDISLKGDKDK